MAKRIVVDTSTGCLDYYNHNHDIRTIRIKVDLDGKLLADGTEIKADEFYKLLMENRTLVPKTSQPSVGELLEFFESLAQDGFEEVIVTTISAKLSGTFNGICQCARILEEKIKIIPFDTKTVCFSEGCFALKAAEMIDENKTTEEIISTLEFMRDHNKIMFAVDDLTYLVKNGRLSGAAGFIGGVLKIKPLLEIVENGSIQAVEKIRTTKKALEAVCHKVSAYIEGHDYWMYIAYTGDELKSFLEDSLEVICGIKGIYAAPCTPIVGCHVGPQAIGIGIFLKD